MRPPYALSIMLILAGLVPLMASGQDTCWTAIQYQQCSNTCSDYMNTVNEQPDGYTYIFIEASCCGVQTLEPYYYEDVCYIVDLKRPETIRSLAKLSHETHLMVASCDGYLRRVPPLQVIDNSSGFGPDRRTFSPDRSSIIPDDKILH